MEVWVVGVMEEVLLMELPLMVGVHLMVEHLRMVVVPLLMVVVEEGLPMEVVDLCVVTREVIVMSRIARALLAATIAMTELSLLARRLVSEIVAINNFLFRGRYIQILTVLFPFPKATHSNFALYSSMI